MVGNERLKERLLHDILANRLAHAYILEAPAGCGKHTLAMQIAAALSCENRSVDGLPLPCRDCPSCRKILSGNSPDVIVVGREDRTTLGVDVIRKMHNDVYVAPNELDCKIYIIEDAHTMTVQAQNAFLLTLEEPPAHVRFFLLCESTALLLETVRSRAPTLRLQLLSAEDVGAYLLKTEASARMLSAQAPEELRELTVASEGSIGKAKKLLDPKQRRPILEQRAAALDLMRLCEGHHNSAAMLTFFNGLGQKRDELIDTVNVMLLCVRDLFLCKQTESAPICFFASREDATELSYRFSSPELLKIINALTDAIDRLRANANVRLTVTELVISISGKNTV